MFSRSDGPTALRADLVRALAFSVQQGELETQDGRTEPAVAALAGVWNGRKGFVAVVVYRIPSQTVERYVYSEAIQTEGELHGAVEEGLGFAESLGFGMDAPEFVTLGAEAQEQRLRLWNKLRKPRPGIEAPAEPRAPEAIAEPPAPDPVPDPSPAAPGVPAEPPPPPAPHPRRRASDFAVDSQSGRRIGDIDPHAAAPAASACAAHEDGRAVLGRIELVRRDAEGRPDPLARLLSHL